MEAINAGLRIDPAYAARRSMPDPAVPEGIKECPCDTCPYRTQCATEKLACRDYQSFTKNTLRRISHRKPTRTLYRQTMGAA